MNILDGEKLGNLPSTTPFVDGNIDRVDRKCRNAKLFVVSCASRHAWISRGLVTVPKARTPSIDRTPWPGAAARAP